MLNVGLKGPLCHKVFVVIRLETEGDGNMLPYTHAEANSYTRIHSETNTAGQWSGCGS